ncbi:hypothetical protein [Streptomyces rubrogriseus]|uniref:hypothetical protein n=2 Tax=Streptomyces rubrogriseus TaxID=194673 RepID=UPI000D59DC2B|nr:hypothetical protein [Streptomyces rubrogriseus]
MTRSRPGTAPSLPPVAPEVFAAAVEGLSTRLRRRLDAAVESLAATSADAAEDGTYGIRCGEDALVTLTPGPSGTITSPDQARCTCLLSPRCLHRTAALGAAPVADPAPPAETAPPAQTPPPTAPVALPARGPSAGQVRAAEGLWTAAAAVLAAGMTAAGAVAQAELLRAAHTARLAGLHRAEGAALDVVRHLRDARDPQGAHRVQRPAQSVAALRELLLVTHRLKAADPDPGLIGAVVHHHRPDGPLRLYGVCREPVVGPGALGGVLTHLVDDAGNWYTLPDVAPGGPERAGRAGTAHVAVRSFLSDHERLSRGGLVVTGAVVAPDGRLLAEPGVRATFAAGRPWAGFAFAAAAADRTGDAPPLTGCDVEIVAADGEAVLARIDTGDGPGPAVRLAPAHRHPALAHTANLRRLGACPGLRVRVLGRVDPDRVTTLRPLAVGPVPGPGAATLRLPEDWRDRADLGYDRLCDAHFPAAAPGPAPSPAPLAAADASPVDSPLRRVRDLVELAVTGGRRATAEPARDSDRGAHAAALRRGGFATGADLFAALGAVAARRPRDAFGRPAGDDLDQYAAQWLATAVYLTGTEAALRRDLWHR